MVENGVNPEVLGVYSISYSVEDPAGNLAEAFAGGRYTGDGVTQIGLIAERGQGSDLTKPVDKSDLPNAVRKLLPKLRLDGGVLIIEEGTALADLLNQAQGEEPFEIKQTADLDEAIQWLSEQGFGTILVGQHSEMDAVAKFMENTRRSDEHGHTPIVLLNSIELESMNADQLLSFIRIHQDPEET